MAFRSVPAHRHRPRRFGRHPALIVAIALVVLIRASAAIAAQASPLSGTVLDQLGAAIRGAAVVLLDSDRTVAETTTDDQGRFTFPAVSPGRYSVLVRAAGFLPRTVDSFFVGAGTRPAVPVTLSIGLAQAVVVTAAAIELPASEVAASVTVIDRGTIDALNKPSLAEVLRIVPGVHIVQTGAPGGTTGLYIRGGASNFNKILIDGVPANDIGGSFDFQDASTTGIDHVEVLRNANSVLYGTDALAGVVEMTTERGRSKMPLLTYEGSGGNFSTNRHEVSLGGTASKLDYFTAFSQSNTDNAVPNNTYRNRTFAGRLGWTSGGRTDITAVVRASAGKFGSPGATDFLGMSDDSTRTGADTTVSVTAQSRISARWRSMVRLSVLDHTYQSVNPAATGEAFDPFGFGAVYLGQPVTVRGANGYSASGQAILDFGTPPNYPQVFDLGTTRTTALGQATFSASDRLDVSAGVRLEHETGFTELSESPRAESTRNNWGAFVEARARQGRLSATAGLGVDRNAVFGTVATPRVSVGLYLRDPSSTQRLSDTKLTFNAGAGIKAPSISQELSSLYDLLSSAQAIAAGVTPIGPERSRGFDTGIEQGLWQGRARVRAAYFDSHFSDLIEFLGEAALTRFGVPADAAAAAGISAAFGAYINSSSYNTKGIEVSAEGRMGGIDVSGSYTFVDAVVTKSFSRSALGPQVNPAFPDVPIGQSAPLVGARPFRRPAHAGSLFVRYAHGPAQLALSTFFSGKQDDSTFLNDGFFGTSLLLPNHNLDAAFAKVDLSGSYRIHQRLRWYVSVENLFDATYEAAAGYPALGRAVRTGVRIDVGGDRRTP